MPERYSHTLLVAGTDEAGRGCLAGPVTAAAIILPPDFEHPVLTDSKQLTEKQREHLLPILEENGVTFGVCHLPPETIDTLNILNASIAAMHGALDQFMKKPELVLVDGNRFKPYSDVPHECVVKGDSKYLCIAAASVLAKTHRDAFMLKLHQEYPQYHWDQNKGYPTKAHREAIRKYGLTPYHRKSFRQLPEQMTLDL
ncbi:MAG: ribonuclease HII [Bacteroidota bacterium]